MAEVRRTIVADAVHLQSVLSHKRLRPFLAEPVGRKRSGGHRLYGYSVGTLWVFCGYSMGTLWVLEVLRGTPSMLECREWPAVNEGLQCRIPS